MGTTDHLSIGEVAERTGLAVSALRYYEHQGLVHPVRTAGGQRRFPRDDLRRLAFVQAAQHVGLSLAEIRAALHSLPHGRVPTPEDWAVLSRAWRDRLDERLRLLEGLRDRLDSCIGCGCLSLERCALYNPDDAAAALGQGPRYLLGDRPDDVVAPGRVTPRSSA